MAKQKKSSKSKGQTTPRFSDTSANVTNNYTGGLTKDVFDSYLKTTLWTHARNAVNNSADGDGGVLGNEPANLECGIVPYTIIGTLHLYADQWIIYSTDDTNSEIGRFDDSKCEYTTLVNDACLKFNRKNLITGASKENFDCTWQVYWDDGINPSRTLNVDNIPYIQQAVSAPNDPCIIYENVLPLQLDCEKIRLAPLMDTPCVRLIKAEDGGQLRNGTYQAYIAYTVNGQMMGDYIGISNLQSIFDHNGTAGSLRIEFSNVDQDFEEFELVILSNNQENIVAKRIGIYSTNTKSVLIDFIDQSLVTVPLSMIPLIRPSYEKSQHMYVVGDYLIRSGPTEQFDFNYQPLANQIRTEWVVGEYPANYYYKGGNKVGYLRDEVYAFFIRFIYNTGERSSSYHIPGRVARGNTGNQQFQANKPTPGDLLSGAEDQLASGINVIDSDYNYQVYNTARFIVGGSNVVPLDPFIPGQPGAPVDSNDAVDPGLIIARGEMAYWQSTERYPNKPDIWNANVSGRPEFDLCSKNIRHHKMPNEDLGDVLFLSNNNKASEKIRILGVDFGNIQRPIDNDGNVISNIVGYEILRGSREGNKSILAKGIFRNMRTYIPTTGATLTSNRTISVYPNYPYNELDYGPGDVFFYEPDTFTLPNGAVGIPANADPVLSSKGKDSSYPNTIEKLSPLRGYRQDVFTFHSPELMFKRPFLNAYETRLYAQKNGNSSGRFIHSEEHPGFKLLRNRAIILATIIGSGFAMTKMQGKVNKTSEALKMNYLGYVGHKKETYDLAYDSSGTTSGDSTGSVGLTLGTGGPIKLNNSGNFNGNGSTTGDIEYTNTGADGDDKTPMGGVAPGKDDQSLAIATESSNKVNERNEENNETLFGNNKAINTDPNQKSNGEFNQPFFKKLLPGPLFTKLLAGDMLTGDFDKTGGENASTSGTLPGTSGGGTSVNVESTDYQRLPKATRIIYGLSMYYTQLTIGGQEILDAILNFASFYNLDLKYISEGFYFNEDPIDADRFRFRNLDSNYIGSSFQNFGSITNSSSQLFRINNLFRPNTVAVQLEEDMEDPTAVIDNSRISLGRVVHEENFDPGETKNAYKNPYQTWQRDISVNYGGLKFEFDNQYGQLEGVKQVQIRGCVKQFTKAAFQQTGPLFGGDTYVGRYTEKTIMPIFTKFLKGDPDGFSFEYLNYINIPFPRYWVDSTKYDLRDELLGAAAGIFNGQPLNDKFVLDRNSASLLPALLGQIGGKDPNKFFIMSKAYFYTHVCGVQDFYVESEINLAQRDYEDTANRRFYDIYQYNDLQALFHADIIQDGNFYKYDYSLSASRFITNLTSFGAIQPRDYDPQIAEDCFTFYPKRLIYSLQAQDEAKKDFWRVFLPNNYKDFVNKITVIKPVNRTGAIMLFPYQSPRMFMGVDQLQTDLGTKVTVGDGGLFEQAMQNIVNAESGYEYGSCESNRAVINTPYGVFYVSQKQGKVFQYAGQLTAISDLGMKQWFNNYLPSQLLMQYPELEDHVLGDNPVIGIGCQIIYDDNFGVLYISKKDYKVKDEFVNDIAFDKNRGFIARTAGRTNSNPDIADPSGVIGNSIEAGDPRFFDDLSWTVSYDPKAKVWVSFHDWHPELVMASTDHFFTTKTDTRDGSASIWRHNDRCDLFTNYYGKDYPFEIETPITTGEAVTTIRSLEYQLEAYVYKGNLENACADDRWHDLDFNFDQAIIYNTEQVSGLLNLNISPKNNPFEALNYPIINTSSIDILYSKEEQKYRFNQFWDVTKDRGEFTLNVQQQIFNTELNGYIRNLNLNNLDYQKPPLQRKKFRHYTNKVMLRRRMSRDRKMLFKVNTVKLYNSPR